jgi:putative hydroxymethylpyrimidine transport system permease protein
MKRLMRIAVSAALILMAWQALVTFGNIPHFILPSPIKTATTLWEIRGLIASHAWVTSIEILLGLMIGTLLGSLTAIWLARSSIARYLVQPVLVLTQALPVFALAPVFTLWLGYGMASKILVAVLIIYFPVASAFFDGLMQTPKAWLNLGKVMGASPRQLLWHIQIPAALPHLASGLRLAAVYAPIGAIIGEWVGASEGLGYLMLLANGRAKIDLMFAALLVLALLTLCLHYAVGKLCDILVKKYAPSAQNMQ